MTVGLDVSLHVSVSSTMDGNKWYFDLALLMLQLGIVLVVRWSVYGDGVATPMADSCDS